MSDESALITRAFSEAESAAARFKIRSTSIFYSNPWLSLRPGEFYIVGQNPGGSPQLPSQTEEGLRGEVRKRPWSAYLDQSNWQADNLQGNLGRLADAVWGGRSRLRDMFATNAIFFRDDGSIVAAADAYFNACWPLHAEFLEIVRPAKIVTIGNGPTSAYSLFVRKLQRPTGAAEIPVYGTFRVRATQGEMELGKLILSVQIVGLPHLSRCNVVSRPAAVAEVRKRGWL